MTRSATANIERIHSWLTKEVFPLWLRSGFDETRGCFVESFSRDALPEQNPRRAIVQMRQVYSVCEGVRMGLLNQKVAEPLVCKAVDHLISSYSQTTGAFIHSVDVQGNVVNPQEDLYTQAFVLFGLAHAYEFTGNSTYKQSAHNLLHFLNQNRRHPAGGYTEIIQGRTLFQSNPHMHLFEAALAWMKADSDQVWKNLASHLYDLCRTKFVDPHTQILAEHFHDNWQPVLHDGRFIFEPGHQFEWAWLLLQYQALTGVSTEQIPFILFNNGQKFGVNQKSGYVFDEVWSDFSPKKMSSRLWPHCEWIKAALETGMHATDPVQTQLCAKIADQGLETLFQYFKGLKPGLWEDLHTEEGSFTPQSIKASSLYHIVNALSEYTQKRTQLSS